MSNSIKWYNEIFEFEATRNLKRKLIKYVLLLLITIIYIKQVKKFYFEGEKSEGKGFSKDLDWAEPPIKKNEANNSYNKGKKGQNSPNKKKKKD